MADEHKDAGLTGSERLRLILALADAYKDQDHRLEAGALWLEEGDAFLAEVERLRGERDRLKAAPVSIIADVDENYDRFIGRELMIRNSTIDNARAALSSPAGEAGSDEKGCTCHRCIREKGLRGAMGLPLSSSRMIVCQICGNKRCPKAEDHRFACTGSNEPGQVGQAEAPTLTAHERESAVAKAIHEADCGYAIRLESLTDDGDTYNAKYDLTFPTGEKPLTFASHDAAETYATGWRYQRMARAAIRALADAPARAEEWLPIETAPKDGTRILWCSDNGRYTKNRFSMDVVRWPDYAECFAKGWWRPLPSPPALSAKESQGGER